MSENEYWQIVPFNQNGEQRFTLMRYVNGKINESYRSRNASETLIDLAAVINGFRPPRSLEYLDKPSD